MKHASILLIALFAVACSSAGDGDDGMDINPPPGPFCGDGMVNGQEQCDDSNRTAGDGCSATCTTEVPNLPICGDGALNDGEECDDGNNDNGDGCDSECKGETGPTGGGGGGGTVTGSGTCAAPYDITLTDNMGVLEGGGTGDTTTSTNQVMEAACDGGTSGAGNDHVWKLTLAAAADVYVIIDDQSTFDTAIRFLTAPCDVATEVAEYTGADGCADGNGASEQMGYVNLAAGTYYVVIDGYMATDMGQYGFSVFAVPTTCGDGQVDALEFCDDGNMTDTDGCNNKCEIAPGYTCTSGQPSVCTMGSSAVAPAPGDLVMNEFMPGDNASDTNCDGKTTGTDDEFIELVNKSTKTLNLDGVTISDSIAVRHTFGATTVAPGDYIVVWSAGTPMCPGVTKFDVASSGYLSLNDAGDTITLALGSTLLHQVQYGTAPLNKSFNHSPDVTGTSWKVHDQVTGAVGNYSPGLHVDGSPF